MKIIKLEQINTFWKLIKEIFLKKLTAGDNITINDDVISADVTEYIAGDNISINNGVISALGYVWTSSTSSFAENISNNASGFHCHAEGTATTASLWSSHAEGYGSVASNDFSHAEGYISKADGSLTSNTLTPSSDSSGLAAHAEGNATVAAGSASHSEGRHTFAQGIGSHAEGNGTMATQYACHAEGNDTTASGIRSHAEGDSTIAAGSYSHAENYTTTAIGNSSHAEGRMTKTMNEAEHAEGKYNKSNKASTTYGNSGNTQHSVGIGSDENNRKNAFEIMQNGDIYVHGIGNYTGTNIKAVGNKIKTLLDVINASSESIAKYYFNGTDDTSEDYGVNKYNLLVHIHTTNGDCFYRIDFENLEDLGLSITFSAINDLLLAAWEEIALEDGDLFEQHCLEEGYLTYINKVDSDTGDEVSYLHSEHVFIFEPVAGAMLITDGNILIIFDYNKWQLGDSSEGIQIISTDRTSKYYREMKYASADAIYSSSI